MADISRKRQSVISPLQWLSLVIVALFVIVPFYTTDFTSNGKTFEQWLPTLEREVAAGAGRPVQTKDLSVLHWKDVAETMVVTFAELPAHARTGPTRRQYWIKVQGQWKIFFEGVIG